MGRLARLPSGAPTSATRHQLERRFYARATKWLGTSVVTWTIWGLTGAPTGLPHGTRTGNHTVITLGIWPAYVMVGGLVDIARRARALYVQTPELDGVDGD